jgi:hypothetical protein
MAWQNLGNIQKPPSVISKIQQLGWVTCCAHFNKTYAVSIKRLIYLARKQLELEGKQQQQKRMVLRRRRERERNRQLGRESSGNSISIHTKLMRSGDMPTPSGSLDLQIIIIHSRWVTYHYILSIIHCYLGGTWASTRKASLQSCTKGKARSRHWSTSSAGTLNTSAARTQ